MISRQQALLVSLSLVLVALVAAPAPAASAPLPPNNCLFGNCPPDPPECTPDFELASRVVGSITFVQKKDNDVCVYQCSSTDTFHDSAECPGSSDFSTSASFRVRFYVGAFACPAADPAFCCDTDPRPGSCSW